VWWGGVLNKTGEEIPVRTKSIQCVRSCCGLITRGKEGRRQAENLGLESTDREKKIYGLINVFFGNCISQHGGGESLKSPGKCFMGGRGDLRQNTSWRVAGGVGGKRKDKGRGKNASHWARGGGG